MMDYDEDANTKFDRRRRIQRRKWCGRLIVLVTGIALLVWSVDWYSVRCIVEAQCEGTTTCVNGSCESFLAKTSLGFGCIAPCYEEYQHYFEHYYLKTIDLMDGYGSIKGCTIEFVATGSNNGSTKEEYDAKTTSFGIRMERVKGTSRWAGMCEDVMLELELPADHVFNTQLTHVPSPVLNDEHDDKAVLADPIQQARKKSKLQIWQTVKTLDIPPRIYSYREEWIRSTPDAEFHLLDDKAVLDWVSAHYPKDSEFFQDLPLGVMRADWWRYMVIAKEGGLYIDADVQMKRPVSSWAEMGTCDVIIALENDLHFCNWAIYAREPGHPLLTHIVDTVRERLRNPTDEPDPIKGRFNVHSHTGPSVFSHAITVFYNMTCAKGWCDAIEIAVAVRDRNDGICFIPQEKFSGEYLQNTYSSLWSSRDRGHAYGSWTEEADHLGYVTLRDRN